MGEIGRKATKPDCPRCGRPHSGLCGIPPGVTKGFGARRPIYAGSDHPVKTEKGIRGSKPSTDTLKELLHWGEKERDRVHALLRVLPADMPEYNVLLEKAEALEATINRVKIQLGQRET